MQPDSSNMRMVKHDELGDVFLLTPEELNALLERSAEAGAAAALKHLGLSDQQASDDLREMRDVLASFRAAKGAVAKGVLDAMSKLATWVCVTIVVVLAAKYGLKITLPGA